MLIDKRDRQQYPIVKIGGTWWMAKNLNFAKPNSFCLNNEEKSCSVYGRLYTWKASLNACPKGWRLPNQEEWTKMLDVVQKENDSLNTNYYEVIRIRYAKLIKGGESKFDALIGGNRNPHGYFYRMNGFYWTSSEKTGTKEAEKRLNETFAGNYGSKFSDYGMSIWFRPEDKRIYSNNAPFVKKNAFSCRCIKNESN
ncbi:FISUMP domain-containing protein [Tenacibaculum sp. 190130A14a]|uniref:FISUMP domain-containing protein n=1 Tax=Tenacibaculum polynesiense TaxID=3137857 RepID=UPI0032B24E64